jgi:HD-GYP domain-containing protein (c-di-GMP phosphodiesterase class II)
VPVTSAIVAIADAFDAMTHRRSHREAMPVDHPESQHLAGEERRLEEVVQ